MVTQCPISKWFSQDEFWDFKLSNGIMLIAKTCDREKGKEIKAFCDKGQHSWYDVDLS